MQWDMNERGTINLTPLIEHSTAALYDTGCGLRLVLSRPEDPYGTGSLVVQMAMTVEQATALVRDIQRTIDHILSSASAQKPN